MMKIKFSIISLAFSLLFLNGCSDYKCVDGKVYHQLDQNVWAESGIWKHTTCVTEVKK
jgi:PBP1b-binding outer membrane lipoprotein LpoB